MNKKEELAYMRGERAVWRHLAAEAARHLPGAEGDIAHLVAEKDQIMEALRELAELVDYKVDGDMNPVDLIDEIGKCVQELLEEES